MTKVYLFVICLSSILLVTTGCKKEHIIEPTPVVNAGTDQTIELPVDSVVLSGSATVQNDKIVAYLWSEVSGPNTPSINTPGASVSTVKGLVPGIYVFQLMALDSSGETGVDMVTVTVNPAVCTQKTLYLRPGPTDGRDVFIVNVDGLDWADINQKPNPELVAARWTWYAQNGGEGTIRSLLKFTGLSAVPATSIIDSAFLSLYGLTADYTIPINPGNSNYPGSPYDGDNKCWLQKVTSDWTDNTVTWNTQPSSSSNNQVEIPTSTALYNYNALHLDVTKMVQDIVNSGQNFGFMMRLQTEQIYRSMTFGSSRTTDSTLRPRLQVYYK